MRPLLGGCAAAVVEPLAQPIGPPAWVGVAVLVQGHQVEQQVETGAVAEALRAAVKGTLDLAQRGLDGADRVGSERRACLDGRRLSRRSCRTSASAPTAAALPASGCAGPLPRSGPSCRGGRAHAGSARMTGWSGSSASGASAFSSRRRRCSSQSRSSGYIGRAPRRGVAAIDDSFQAGPHLIPPAPLLVDDHLVRVAPRAKQQGHDSWAGNTVTDAAASFAGTISTDPSASESSVGDGPVHSNRATPRRPAAAPPPEPTRSSPPSHATPERSARPVGEQS